MTHSLDHVPAAMLIALAGAGLTLADGRRPPEFLLAQAGSGSSRYEEPAGSGSAHYPEPVAPGPSGMRIAHGAAVAEASFPKAPDSGKIQAEAAALVKRDVRLKGGHFLIADPISRKVRALRVGEVHQPVSLVSRNQAVAILRSQGREELEAGVPEAFLACVDFEDAKSGEKLDIDLWMIRQGGRLAVQDFVIHAVDGVRRFRYGTDRAIPEASR